MRWLWAWLADLVRRFARTLDLPLTFALLALMVIGLMVMQSAGNERPGLVWSQAARFAAGFAAMWVLSRVPLHRLRTWTPWLFVLSLLPLAAVLVLGRGRSGNLWLNLGVFYFQPSEVLKLLLPMMLAWWLNRAPLPPRLPQVLGAALLIAVPVGLILLQPDFGTAMLVAASGVFVLFLAGLSWRWFAAAGLSAAAAAPLAWFFVFRPYQKDRILTFLEPERDPLGTGWNILQSKIAIGGGGWMGQGWGHGSQSHLDYLPEHTTDFAFAVFSEEFGWLGVLVVLALYLFIIGRCLWIANEACDSYARLVAGSLGMSLFVYVLVNGGMIAGLLPVVGVPMPLISYGGTYAVVLLAAFGVVMAVAERRTLVR